jgi:hypothetical protein
MTSFLLKEVSANLHELLPLVDLDIRPLTFDSKNLLDGTHKDGAINHASCTIGTDGGNSNLGESKDSSKYSCPKIAIIDGFYLQRIYSRIIDKKESQLNHIHIVFDDILVCTYDENDKRYHARPIICGSPSVISIPSIIEGPAKPKGYYFKQMMKDLLCISSKEIENEFAGTFVTYDDPRLMQVTTGYAIQAIFFFLNNGNPFCSQYPCRLFNSHWQEELIYTQVINPVLCKEHLRLLAQDGN